MFNPRNLKLRKLSQTIKTEHNNQPEHNIYVGSTPLTNQSLAGFIKPINYNTSVSVCRNAPLQ
jgi:hypothetical protein